MYLFRAFQLFLLVKCIWFCIFFFIFEFNLCVLLMKAKRLQICFLKLCFTVWKCFSKLFVCMFWDQYNLIIEVEVLKHLALSCYVSEDPIFLLVVVSWILLLVYWHGVLKFCLNYYSFRRLWWSKVYNPTLDLRYSSDVNLLFCFWIYLVPNFVSFLIAGCVL